MKKLLALVLCFVTCLSMTSCALFGQEHKNHRYRRAWESNAGYHWHECKGRNCKEQGNKEKHTYKNGKCSVCGYKEQTITEHN